MRQLIVEFVNSENSGEEDKASFLLYHGFTVADWVERMSKSGIQGLCKGCCSHFPTHISCTGIILCFYHFVLVTD